MSLYIGRAGLENSLPIPDPTKVSMNGPNEVTLDGELYIGTTQAQALALSQQLRGHVGEDIAFYWTEDLGAGGFGRLKSASVKPRDGIGYATNVFDYQATIEKVPGGQGCMVESRSNGFNRSGFTGTPTSWIGFPSGVASMFMSAHPFQGYSTRSGPGPLGGTGAARVYVDGSPYTSYYNSYNTYHVTPDHFYDMAATFKSGIVASPTYVVTGDQIINLAAGATTWELTNGLVKVVPGSTGMFKVTGVLAPAWSSVSMEWTPQYYNGAVWMSVDLAPNSIQVMQNTPQCVSIRLVTQLTSAGNSTWTVNCDLTLRRGSRFVEVVVGSAQSAPYGLLAASGTWTNTTNNYMWESANDADSNRAAVFSDRTLSTANKRAGTSGTSANFSQFGVGVVIGGSGASVPEQVTDLRDQYFAEVHEVERFVAA